MTSISICSGSPLREEIAGNEELLDKHNNIILRKQRWRFRQPHQEESNEMNFRGCRTSSETREYYEIRKNEYPHHTNINGKSESKNTSKMMK